MPKGEIMRKKLSLILIIVLAMILIATLAACNWKVQQEAPPPSIDPTPPQGLEAQASKVVLNFSMPSYANSVFNAIYVDEFDISKVNYSFVYLAADNSEISSKPMGGLSENMVDLGSASAEESGQPLYPRHRGAGRQHDCEGNVSAEAEEQIAGDDSRRVEV